MSNVHAPHRAGVGQSTGAHARVAQNLVERWFAELTNKMLRRSAHRSISALTTDLNSWIATWNDNPKPFVWHKTADEILDSLKKYLTNL